MRKKDLEIFKKLKGKYLRYFLAGFADGEGSFNVSFAYCPELKGKIKVNVKFQVYQHEKNKEILFLYKKIFKTGRVRKKAGSNVWVFSIEGVRNNLEKVVPFFKKYPLATKRQDFEKFEKILQILSDGSHLTKEKLEKVIDLAYSMNYQGKNRKPTRNQILKRVQKNFEDS